MEIDPTSFERFEFARDGRILRVTLVGSGPANAVDEAMHREFPRLLRELQDDAGSDLIILTGRGGAFCAGGDMDWFQAMIDDPREFRDILPDARRIVGGLLDLEKPVVCRLNGHAAGLGASVARRCRQSRARALSRIRRHAHGRAEPDSWEVVCVCVWQMLVRTLRSFAFPFSTVEKSDHTVRNTNDEQK